MFELGLQPHQACVISGIGCSSNLPGYINSYGMHTLHGRSLAVATGVRCGNHELKVIAPAATVMVTELAGTILFTPCGATLTSLTS